MKTFTNLFPEFSSFENLLLSADKATKGKREKVFVIDFFLNLEENLYGIKMNSKMETICLGEYQTFSDKLTNFILYLKTF